MPKQHVTPKQLRELRAKGRLQRRDYLTQQENQDLWEEYNEVPEFKFSTKMVEESAYDYDASIAEYFDEVA